MKSHFCNSATRTRYQYATAAIGAPSTAAKTSSTRYWRVRSKATTSLPDMVMSGPLHASIAQLSCPAHAKTLAQSGPPDTTHKG